MTKDAISDAPPTPVEPLSLSEAAALVGALQRELGRVIIGQQAVISEILIAFLAGGHCLLRGVPGLAKTLLIKTLAQAVHLKFSRIQFTPDLMPSDILGTEVIEEDRATGSRTIRFIPGPIFANIILADEINRTPPKTQSALLEAMQEYQVTVGGVRHVLERPLFVLATENPIEQEGTYPLPEAQLDRFMLNVVIDYPSADEERAILAQTTTARSRASRPSRRASRSSARACSCARSRPPPTSSTTRRAWSRSSRPVAPAARAGAGLRARLGALGRGPARGSGVAAGREGPRGAAGPAGGVDRGCARGRATGAAPSSARELSGGGRGHRCRNHGLAPARDHPARDTLRISSRPRSERPSATSSCWRGRRSRDCGRDCTGARSTATAPNSASIVTTVRATI